MRFRTTVLRISQIKNRAPFLFQSNQASHSFSQLQPKTQKQRSFGIAFDIDGVVLRGRVPIGGSPQALRRLFAHSGTLKVPFLFLTNGGGIPESKRAVELSELLGVTILPSQVVQGHSPFKNLLKRFENELIVATGKEESTVVMSEYGFKKVLSLDQYASYFENIDPVSQYETWTKEQATNINSHPTTGYNLSSERVKAAFVVSDPVDWGRDIQVLCDILRSGGLPGQANGQQPPLYFAADDLEYQIGCHVYLKMYSGMEFLAAFPSERLGMGAFRTALESIFNGIDRGPLEYVCFGKPNPFVFKNAEAILNRFLPSCSADNGNAASHHFETLYMIGDNPLVDIKGAIQAGHPWFSILTRTGVFKGTNNHAEFPADLVVDTVEEAVEYILKREFIS